MAIAWVMSFLTSILVRIALSYFPSLKACSYTFKLAFMQMPQPLKCETIKNIFLCLHSVCFTQTNYAMSNLFFGKFLINFVFYQKENFFFFFRTFTLSQSNNSTMSLGVWQLPEIDNDCHSFELHEYACDKKKFLIKTEVSEWNHRIFN